MTDDERGGWSEERVYLWYQSPIALNLHSKDAERRMFRAQAVAARDARREAKRKLKGVKRRNPNYCCRGHKRTPENTYIRKGGPSAGYRQCIPCKHLERKRNNPQRWAREKAKRPVLPPKPEMPEEREHRERQERQEWLKRKPPMRGVSE